MLSVTTDPPGAIISDSFVKTEQAVCHGRGGGAGGMILKVGEKIFI